MSKKTKKSKKFIRNTIIIVCCMAPILALLLPIVLRFDRGKIIDLDEGISCLTSLAEERKNVSYIYVPSYEFKVTSRETINDETHDETIENNPSLFSKYQSSDFTLGIISDLERIKRSGSYAISSKLFDSGRIFFDITKLNSDMTKDEGIYTFYFEYDKNKLLTRYRKEEVYSIYLNYSFLDISVTY